MPGVKPGSFRPLRSQAASAGTCWRIKVSSLHQAIGTWCLGPISDSFGSITTSDRSAGVGAGISALRPIGGSPFLKIWAGDLAVVWFRPSGSGVPRPIPRCTFGLTPKPVPTGTQIPGQPAVIKNANGGTRPALVGRKHSAVSPLTDECLWTVFSGPLTSRSPFVQHGIYRPASWSRQLGGDLCFPQLAG